MSSRVIPVLFILSGFLLGCSSSNDAPYVVGGDTSAVADQLYNIIDIYSTYGAFGALREDNVFIT